MDVADKGRQSYALQCRRERLCIYPLGVASAGVGEFPWSGIFIRCLRGGSALVGPRTPAPHVARGVWLLSKPEVPTRVRRV